IVHHDQHTTTIVDLPTRDETLDPTGRVAPEITYTVEPLRWHGYTVWEWHLNDPTMSTCRVRGVQPTEARATQRAAEAARIHEQLHALSRLSSRRWSYEIGGGVMTDKQATRALICQGVPASHALEWLAGIGYKAERPY